MSPKLPDTDTEALVTSIERLLYGLIKSKDFFNAELRSCRCCIRSKTWET